MDSKISEQVSNLMNAFLEASDNQTVQLINQDELDVGDLVKTIVNKTVRETIKSPKKSIQGSIRTDTITFAEIGKYVYGYDAKDNVRKDFEKLIAVYKEEHQDLSGTYLTRDLLKKDVPASIANFIKRMKNKDEKDLTSNINEQRQFAKLLKERTNEAELVRADMERNLQLNAINLLSLSDFIAPEFKKELAKALDLDPDLFPTMISKDIYYHINVVRVSVKLHGKMHNDTYPESQYSKQINKLEEQLINALDVSRLKEIPEKLIKRAQHDVFVIIALYNLLTRANPNAISKLNINNLFISIFDKLLGVIIDSKQRESLSKFIIRTIQHNKKQHEFNIDTESPEVILGTKYLKLVKENALDEQETEQEINTITEQALEDRAIQEERSDEYGGYADFFENL